MPTLHKFRSGCRGSRRVDKRRNEQIMPSSATLHLPGPRQLRLFGQLQRIALVGEDLQLLGEVAIEGIQRGSGVGSPNGTGGGPDYDRHGKGIRSQVRSPVHYWLAL